MKLSLSLCVSDAYGSPLMECDAYGGPIDASVPACGIDFDSDAIAPRCNRLGDVLFCCDDSDGFSSEFVKEGRFALRPGLSGA